LAIENGVGFAQAGDVNRLLCLALALTVLGAAGCRKDAELDAPPSPLDAGEPVRAQPRLQTMKLFLGTNEMLAELALTPEQIRTGMMFRTNMDENSGMIFVFAQPQQVSFWMKNCPLPLSAAYIDSEGVIREIHPLESFNTNSVTSASQEIRFVLETPSGWFDRHNVGAGVAVATERGPLLRTFFGNR
jgi:uncharacterized protein